VDGQVGIMTEAFLDIVRASDNPEQAWIYGLAIRALDYHSHFATDALESCWRSQGHEIVRRGDRILGLCREFDRCPRKQGASAAAGKSDVNSIRMDRYPAHECHQRRFGFVWRVRTKFFRDLTAALDQLALT
jgi:hypothetical protein